MTNQKQADKFIKDNMVICVGILSLTALEMVALFNGINGTMFSMIVMIIGLAIGVTIENPFKHRA